MDCKPLLTFLKSGGLKNDGNFGFRFWQSLAIEHESRQPSPSHTLWESFHVMSGEGCLSLEVREKLSV